MSCLTMCEVHNQRVVSPLSSIFWVIKIDYVIIIFCLIAKMLLFFDIYKNKNNNLCVDKIFSCIKYFLIYFKAFIHIRFFYFNFWRMGG